VKALSRPGSPTWTRTKNLPINSRLLCQLSYRGLRASPGNTSKGPLPPKNPRLEAAA
jgi:hypothetical protein